MAPTKHAHISYSCTTYTYTHTHIHTYTYTHTHTHTHSLNTKDARTLRCKLGGFTEATENTVHSAVLSKNDIFMFASIVEGFTGDPFLKHYNGPVRTPVSDIVSLHTRDTWHRHTHTHIHVHPPPLSFISHSVCPSLSLSGWTACGACTRVSKNGEWITQSH
jgi:hypothetical protein